MQLFTDYMVRLMKYVEFMKKSCRCTTIYSTSSTKHCPVMRKVGRTPHPAGMLGIVPGSGRYCDYKYQNMTDWGRKMFVTPGIVVVDGELITTNSSRY